MSVTRDFIVHPLALTEGYAAMKEATDWSESSCSRIIKPGDLGPGNKVSVMHMCQCRRVTYQSTRLS